MPERNAQAFAQVTSALRARQAVLVFPEGISHDDPTLAPLKSGAARMALQANREGVAGIRFLPIGLVFEAKERPDSRVLVRVGDALDLDGWIAEHSAEPQELTEVLEARLRAVTLNFASAERAARAVHLARVLGTLAGAPAPVDQPESLDAEAVIALRIDATVSALTYASPHLIQAADALVSKLDVIERELGHRGIRLADVRVSTRLPDAVAFVAREGPLALLAGIAVVLGWATHWIPLRAARALALRSLNRNSSRDQPAMRTILFGLSAIVLWYIAQFVVLTRIRGPARGGRLACCHLLGRTRAQAWPRSAPARVAACAFLPGAPCRSEPPTPARGRGRRVDCGSGRAGTGARRTGLSQPCRAPNPPLWPAGGGRDRLGPNARHRAAGRCEDL